MGYLKPISRRAGKKESISFTIGLDGRMYLSSGLKKLLGHTEKQSYYLYYDEEEHRIGLSKGTRDSNIIPFNFSARGEGKVASFVEDCEIEIPGKPIEWLYEGKENGILVFYQKGRKHMRFKADRNGNLERIT